MYAVLGSVLKAQLIQDKDYFMLPLSCRTVILRVCVCVCVCVCAHVYDFVSYETFGNAWACLIVTTRGIATSFHLMGRGQGF
jgi:hypothetical protein